MFTRKDPYRLVLEPSRDYPVTLFASPQVAFDARAIQELQQMLGLQDTLQDWKHRVPDLLPETASLLKVALTPDFHKARGIPVGTVLQTREVLLPQAIGNDVGCGMRLHTTSLMAEQVKDQQKRLVPRLRRIFFEAGRNIPMNRRQREAVLREGLLGLLEATPAHFQEGLWKVFWQQDVLRDTEHTEHLGSRVACSTPGLQDFLGSDAFTRDGQVGSLGGGNHFVEIQRVKRLLDPQTAHLWGLKLDQVVVMVHAGSVSVGHTIASVVQEQVKELRPAGLPAPANGLCPVPMADPVVARPLWDALNSGTNFATVNRLMLALMVQSTFQELGLETDFPLLYDSPHNMVWQDGDTLVHRKGATPARSFSDLQDTPFRYTGEPVLVPGSMGSSSFLLAGQGLPDALSSASHGAGRLLSRGQAMGQDPRPLTDLLERHRIVTPLDFSRARSDLAREKLRELLQEAPGAYKNIQAIIHTLEGAGMARPVAELEPLLTLKG